MLVPIEREVGSPFSIHHARARANGNEKTESCFAVCDLQPAVRAREISVRSSAEPFSCCLRCDGCHDGKLVAKYAVRAGVHAHAGMHADRRRSRVRCAIGLTAAARLSCDRPGIGCPLARSLSSAFLSGRRFRGTDKLGHALAWGPSYASRGASELGARRRGNEIRGSKAADRKPAGETREACHGTGNLRDPWMTMSCSDGRYRCTFCHICEWLRPCRS